MEKQSEQQKWWQKNKQLLMRTGIVSIVVFAFFILLIYLFTELGSPRSAAAAETTTHGKASLKPS